MRTLLSTSWLTNILTDPIPPDFYLEIRAVSPGGKRTQFTYLPIQSLVEQAAGIATPALAAQVESVVLEKVATLPIETIISDKLIEMNDDGLLNMNELSSTNW